MPASKRYSKHVAAMRNASRDRRLKQHEGISPKSEIPRKTCDGPGLTCYRCDEPIKVGARMMQHRGEPSWSHAMCPKFELVGEETKRRPSNPLFDALRERQLATR